MLNSQTIGINGVYRVAVELTNKGSVVSVTSRSAHGIDLHATSPELNKAFSVEVKTCRSGPFLLHKRALTTKAKSYLYVLITYKSDRKNLYSDFKFYVIPSTKMVKLAKAAWNKGAYLDREKHSPF